VKEGTVKPHIQEAADGYNSLDREQMNSALNKFILELFAIIADAAKEAISTQSVLAAFKLADDEWREFARLVGQDEELFENRILPSLRPDYVEVRKRLQALNQRELYETRLDRLRCSSHRRRH